MFNGTKIGGVPGNRKIINWNVLVFITQSNPICSCPEFRSKTTKTNGQSKHFSNFQPILAIEFQNIFVLEHFNFHSANGDICICLFCNNSVMDSKIARFVWTLVIPLINHVIFCFAFFLLKIYSNILLKRVCCVGPQSCQELLDHLQTHLFPICFPNSSPMLKIICWRLSGNGQDYGKEFLAPLLQVPRICSTNRIELELQLTRSNVNFSFPTDSVANWLQNSASKNSRHLEIKLTKRGTMPLEIAAGLLKEIKHLLNELTEVSNLKKIITTSKQAKLSKKLQIAQQKMSI